MDLHIVHSLSRIVCDFEYEKWTQEGMKKEITVIEKYQVIRSENGSDWNWTLFLSIEDVLFILCLVFWKMSNFYYPGATYLIKKRLMLSSQNLWVDFSHGTPFIIYFVINKIVYKWYTIRDKILKTFIIKWIVCIIKILHQSHWYKKFTPITKCLSSLWSYSSVLVLNSVHQTKVLGPRVDDVTRWRGTHHIFVPLL